MEPEEFRFTEDTAEPERLERIVHSEHDDEDHADSTTPARQPRSRGRKLLTIAAAMLLLLGATRIWKAATTQRFEVAENPDGSSPFQNTLIPTWLPIKGTLWSEQRDGSPVFPAEFINKAGQRITVSTTSASDSEWANPLLRDPSYEGALASANGRPGDPNFRVWVSRSQPDFDPATRSTQSSAGPLSEEVLDALVKDLARRCTTTACGNYAPPPNGVLSELRVARQLPLYGNGTTTMVSFDKDRNGYVLFSTFASEGFVLPEVSTEELGEPDFFSWLGGEVPVRSELRIDGRPAILEQSDGGTGLVIDRSDIGLIAVISGLTSDSSTGVLQSSPNESSNGVEASLYGFNESTLRRIAESLEPMSGSEFGQHYQKLANDFTGDRVEVGRGSDWTAFAVTPRQPIRFDSTGCAITIRVDPLHPGNSFCEFDPCSEDEYLRGQRGSIRPLSGGRRIWCGMLDSSVKTVTFNFDDRTEIAVKPTLVAKGKAAVVVIELPAKAGSVEPRDAKGKLSSGEGIDPFTANARNEF